MVHNITQEGKGETLGPEEGGTGLFRTSRNTVPVLRGERKGKTKRRRRSSHNLWESMIPKTDAEGKKTKGEGMDQGLEGAVLREKREDLLFTNGKEGGILLHEEWEETRRGNSEKRDFSLEENGL